jgi:hypothetical protein
MCHCLFVYVPVFHHDVVRATFLSQFIPLLAWPMMDLTIENITQNVHEINSGCPDRRFRYLLERFVAHLHDPVRETRLSTGE